MSMFQAVVMHGGEWKPLVEMVDEGIVDLVLYREEVHGERMWRVARRDVGTDTVMMMTDRRERHSAVEDVRHYLGSKYAKGMVRVSRYDNW